MKQYFFRVILVGMIVLSSCSDDELFESESKQLFCLPEKAYVLAEQERSAILIMNAENRQIVWSWDPVSARIPYAYWGWFVNPSEVKPVFNNHYILMTASGGAVALIRLRDHKVMFYAQAGTNPHSAEILPDGNIVVANSTGHELCTFVTDTVNIPGRVANRLRLGNAHNAVWDKERKLLYATATVKDANGENVTALFGFSYNEDSKNPKLIGQKRLYTFEKDNGGHDLYPVYGEANQLWMTTEQHVWKYDVITNSPSLMYDEKSVKSISNSSDGVIMLKPTQEWWAEGLIDDQCQPLFQLQGARIYKGRWMTNNTFSYPEVHEFRLMNE